MPGEAQLQLQYPQLLDQFDLLLQCGFASIREKLKNLFGTYISALPLNTM
jgi:hypothetical protein